MRALTNTRFIVMLAFLVFSACEEYDETARVFAPGGVWEDPSTGLTWQEEASEGFVSWEAAMDYCDMLYLDGRDDWRAPTISELRSIIVGCDGTVTGGLCAVTDECEADDCSSDYCYGCEYEDRPGEDCYSAPGLTRPCEHYWSSSTVTEYPDRAWAVGFSSGFVYKPRKVYNFHVRCVR